MEGGKPRRKKYKVGLAELRRRKKAGGVGSSGERKKRRAARALAGDLTLLKNEDDDDSSTKAGDRRPEYGPDKGQRRCLNRGGIRHPESSYARGIWKQHDDQGGLGPPEKL